MEPKIRTLLTWCTANNIEIDKRLRIVPDTMGLTVYSGAVPIEPSQTLVRIPKSTVLSVKSCSASQFIPESPYGLEAQLALSLALLVEIERRSRSRWYGYLQSLPEFGVDLPLFWSLDSEGISLEDGREAFRWLEGTEVKKLLTGLDGTPLINLIRKYYDEIVVPTIARVSNEFVTLQPTFYQFCRVYSLVSSRAFLVDAYHGLSMVPIADAFNHSNDHNIHLETEYEVCPECGSLDHCPHDGDIELSSKQLTPSTYGQHIEIDDTYDMVSKSVILPHSEVFNTYGETLSNAQLWTQYGFTLDANENDRVSWDFDDLVRFLGAYSKSNHLTTPLGLSWNTIVESFDVDVFSESELVFQPIEAAFCLDCEGKVSWQLWLVVVSHKCARLVPAEQIVGLSVELGRFQTLLESEEVETNGGTHIHLLPSLAQETASTIVKLCQHRKTRLGNGKDQESLGKLVDELSPSQTRTKLALLQVMTELAILNSCEAVWQDRE